MQLDFTLSFTETQWICFDDSIEILADSLEELDTSIEEHLRQKYQTGTFRIKMFFDFDRFPKWYRQYMPHYFNRDFTYNLN